MIKLKTYQPAIIIGALLLTAIFIYWLFNLFFTYTRDAYIDTHFVQIVPEVDGKIDKLFIKDLQAIKKGQPLLQIHAKPYQDKYEQDKANLAIVIDKYQALNAELISNQEKLKTAQANLTFQSKQLSRYDTLIKTNAVSKEQRDSVVFYYQQAQNNVDIAKANLAETHARLGNAQKIEEWPPYQKAKAQLALASFYLKQTLITSPVDGFITAMLLKRGDYVNKGNPLFAIVNQKNWWVFAKIKENHLTDIMHKSATIWLATGERFEGTVEGIAWAVNRHEAGGAANQSILPFLKKTEYWINIPQRFPVVIRFKANRQPLRIGTSAKVLIYK